MDPNACLLRLRHARYDGDHEEVLLASLDLRRWVDDGGFEPEWTEEERQHIMGD